MLAEDQTQEQLAGAHKRLWQCALQIEDLAALQERNRIARDLHDSLGHALTALNIQLQTAVKLWQIDPSQAQTFLAQAQRLGSIAIKEVRQSVSNLRADALEEQSLEALIESLVENFRQATGVSPSISISLSAVLPREVATTLYRIVQEALTNICKYAAATEVQIQLSATSNKVCLTVTDNGRGFELDQNLTGFGLRGMQERVAALRGHFDLETQLGVGCRILIELPLLEPSLQEQEKPEQTGSIIPPEAQADSQPCTVLSAEQYSRLEEILIELIGPIAPTLLQEVSVQVLSPKEVVENLALHLAEQQRIEFEKKAIFLLQESTIQSQILEPSLQEQEKPEQTGSIIPPEAQADSQPCTVLSAEQYSRIEEILIELIGPIAPTLLQEVSVQVLSPKEVVENLALHLAEQQRIEFEKKAIFLLQESRGQSQIRSSNSPSLKNKTIDESSVIQCERVLTG